MNLVENRFEKPFAMEGILQVFGTTSPHPYRAQKMVGEMHF
jgi:hypothetical protein